jgi:ATP-dependent Lhr-like helicase
LAKRRFREISRISGLIFSGYPGAPKSTRQLQASSSLFYDVFRKYDPDNLLLTQAQQEVLRQELEVERLEFTLLRLQTRRLQTQHIKRPTPFGFPLLVERFRENLTSEKLADRITRMVRDLEKAAGGEADEEELREQARFSVAEPVRTRSEKSRTRRPRPPRRTRIKLPRPRHGF